jgi:acyl carrier protein
VNSTAKVKAILLERLGVEQDDLDPDARLLEDLNADSLDVVDVILDLEEALDIEIADEDANKWKTVGDVLAFVKAHS